MKSGDKTPKGRDSQRQDNNSTSGAGRKRRLNRQGQVLVSLIAAVAIAAIFMIAGPLLIPSMNEGQQSGPTTQPVTTLQVTETAATAPAETQTDGADGTEAELGTVSSRPGEGDGTSLSDTSSVTTSVYRPILSHQADPLAQDGYRLIPRTYPHPLVIEPKPSDLFAAAEAEGSEGKAGLYADESADFRGAQLFLMDYEREEPLYVHNARDRAWPASLTKMLTVIVMLEEKTDLSETVTITQEMLNEMARLNASVAGFSAGEQVSYLDLAYASMLPSAGEAAYAIAVGMAGSEAAYAEVMNDFAAEIGMTRSNFTNSTGLHDNDQYSTAEDLGILMRYCWQNETFREIASSDTYTTSPTPQHPSGVSFVHTVLSVVDRYEHEGFKVLGGKSGYTVVGGQCWATVVESGGRLYVAVTLASRTAPEQMSSPCYDTFKLVSKVDEG